MVLRRFYFAFVAVFGIVAVASGATLLVPSVEYPTLQDALFAASNGDEIWVAEGVYTPDEGFGQTAGDRGATFQLRNRVAIYGGFPVGSGDWNDRDPEVYETTLSGDLSGNDGPDFANNGENSYHVVTGSGTNATAVLDGFTITGGNANGSWVDKTNKGGGMYNNYGSPKLINCTFSKNSGSDGGGMYNRYSSPTLINCTFTGNIGQYGGGMCSEYSSTPVLINCIFNGNSASKWAGGMYNGKSNSKLTNCIFSENSASDHGGGISNMECDPILTNCTLISNSASDEGGGIYNWGTRSNPTLTNCILWGNSDSGGVNESSQIHGGPFIINYSCLQGWTGGLGGTGNIGADPCFVAPDDYHLMPGSACINAGDPAFVPGPDEVDMDGDARVFDGRVDMGTDEFSYYVVADAGSDQYLNEIQMVTLDGSGSYFHDPCGVKQFHWEQTAGPEVTLSDPNVMQPTFMPGSEDEYRFTLVVSDDSNTSEPDEVMIIVGNLPPVADAGSDIICWVGGGGQQVSLDGTGSYDLNPAEVLTYIWTQQLGPVVVLQDSNTPTPYFDCTEEGLYTFELVVSDGILSSEPSVVKVRARSGEFQINTSNENDQINPSVAVDGTGNFVVVWRSRHEGNGIYGQQFSANGALIGGEFQINITSVAGRALFGPSVAMDSLGNFVVAWTGYDGGGENGEGIIARRYNPSGIPLSDEFIVNTYTHLGQALQSVAMNANGAFVIVWRSWHGTDEHNGKAYVTGRLYNPDGVPQGDEFIITQLPNGWRPDVAIDNSGDFVVTWLRMGDMDDLPYGDYIRFRRYSSDGTPKEDAVQITGNLYCALDYVGPSIATDGNGNFVITWSSSLGWPRHDVYAQSFDADGDVIGTTFKVNTYLSGAQRKPSISMNEHGRFAIAWCGSGEGDGSGIFAQRYESDGTPVSNEFQINTYVSGNQRNPTIAMNKNTEDTFVAVWTSDGQDGWGYGIFGEFGYFPVEVQMKFTPKVLNCSSKGKWVKAHFVLPEDFTVGDVDVSEPAVLKPLNIQSNYINVFMNKDELVEVEIAFERSVFCEDKASNKNVEVTVEGTFVSGQHFFGTDTIRIITNKVH